VPLLFVASALVVVIDYVVWFTRFAVRFAVVCCCCCVVCVPGSLHVVVYSPFVLLVLPFRFVDCLRSRSSFHCCSARLLRLFGAFVRYVVVRSFVCLRYVVVP
jgi:hypothetical protein